MTKKEWDKLTKKNVRYHVNYGYTPHPRSERSLSYKQGRGKLTEAKDPLKSRKAGDVKRRAGHLRQFRASGSDMGPHLRRILGL